MDRQRLRGLGRTLTSSVDWPNANWDQVDFRDAPEPLATVMPIGLVACIAFGAVGLAGNAIAAQRGAPTGGVTIDPRAAALAMCANDYLRVEGTAPVSWPELTRFYRASDGWVFLHGGFPPHAKKLVAALDAPLDREGLAARIAEMTAQEVEDRCIAANTCGRRLRTPEAWAAHPAAAAVAERPVLDITELPPAEPRAWTGSDKPLTGVRVLDFSRVLAGPTIGRTLAEHGADVLRIASPNLPSIEPLVIDTGFGKRSTFIDLETETGRAALSILLADADVVIDGYRPDALARHGLDPAKMAAQHPGLIYLTLSAFGEHGPWGGARGYDSLVQAAVGLSGGEPPRRLPCQPLDYLAGYLGAFGVMRALIARAETGAGSRIALSLAGMAHWLRQMAGEIGAVAAPPDRNPGADDVADELTSLDTPFGRVTSLRPALDVPWRPREWAPPVPLGTHPAEWA